MNMQITKNGTGAVVALEGRLDTVTSEDLNAALGNELAGAENLVFDLSRLEYISSAGLRALLAAHRLVEGRMKLTHVNEIVLEVLEVTGFNRVLTVE